MAWPASGDWQNSCVLHLCRLDYWSHYQHEHRRERLHIGSPGIPVVTGQNSLSRRARPLELGRPRNAVIFSLEFRKSLHIFSFSQTGPHDGRSAGGARAPRAQRRQRWTTGAPGGTPAAIAARTAAAGPPGALPRRSEGEGRYMDLAGDVVRTGSGDLIQGSQRGPFARASSPASCYTTTSAEPAAGVPSRGSMHRECNRCHCL